MPQIISKDPESILDFSVDLTNLLQSGEAISSSDWEVDSGITQVTETETSSVATIWLSGGTLNNQYTAKNTVVTNSTPARTFVNRIYIPITEK